MHLLSQIEPQFMNIYMYIYIYMWGCVYICMYIYVYIYTYIYVYIYICIYICIHTYIYIYIYTRIINKFPDFFVWALLFVVHTWNYCPLWGQCTCCTVLTTLARPHSSLLAWACQWPSPQPLSSPQLSHNDSLWA